MRGAREIFYLGCLAVLLAMISCPSMADSEATAVVKLASQGPKGSIPENFIGLSIGYKEAVDGKDFVPTNLSLIRLLRGLGGHGVMRDAGIDFGLHSAAWPTESIVPYLQFLQKIGGWSLIHTLPMAYATPSASAAQAEAFQRAAIASHIPIVFAFANEPDAHITGVTRSSSYANEAAYLSAWSLYRDAVVADFVARRLPVPKFEGPDTTWQTLSKPLPKEEFDPSHWDSYTKRKWPTYPGLFADWVNRNGSKVEFISFHYYGGYHSMGLSAAQLVDRLSLLKPLLLEAETLTHQLALPIRVTETNSIAGGGTDGVSNAAISAIWALEEMIRLAKAGILGVNFHRNPNGFYNWCDPDPTDRGMWQARPLYYAIKMFAMLENGRLLPLEINHTNTINGIAVSMPNGDAKILLINLDFTVPEAVTIRTPWKSANALFLSAADHAAKASELGGTIADKDGNWTPIYTAVKTQKGDSTVSIPPLGAALITLH